MEQHVEDLRNEVTDKLDCSQERNDRLLKKLETKMGESVRDLVAKLKKTSASMKLKSKKLVTEVHKVAKEAETLAERVSKLESKPKRKCNRRVPKPAVVEADDPNPKPNAKPTIL